MVKILTHGYLDDGILHQKVVGLFTEMDKLEEAVNTIIRIMNDSGIKLIGEVTKENNNYSFSFENDIHFYTGDYTLNELSNL